MKSILELKDISAGYKKNIVLKDINLTVFENDFLGIIGPNGGGKTTLLKVMLGLIKPFKGRIIFKNNPKESLATGYLPQFSVLDNQFPIKVMDVVLSGLMSKKKIFYRFNPEEKKKADEILEKLGASDLKNEVIGELSGGQRQRVFLARALISSPELLILDEPSTFIDSNLSGNLNEILTDLNKEMAIVLVSHDNSAIVSSVKNIACVNSGLHYHKAEEFSSELMEKYSCPIRFLSHGDHPHTMLKKHECE